MKKSLLLTFILLAMTVWVGAKIVSAASDNSNKPDSPPGQAKKEDNSQGNQGNQDNNNPPGQQNKPEDTGRGTGDHKITICHLPPGNPANAQSIEIDKSAWETGHSPHNSHALDFIIDGSHPCPPKNNPGGGDNNNNPGGSNNNNNGNGGTGGSSTSQKQGEVLGAAAMAATGSTETQLVMTLLQMLGAAAATIGWVAYGTKKV